MSGLFLAKSIMSSTNLTPSNANEVTTFPFSIVFFTTGAPS